MDTPNIGDMKPCILSDPPGSTPGDGNECEGMMELKIVSPHTDTMIGGPESGPREGAQPIPGYRAWVCNTCGAEQRV